MEKMKKNLWTGWISTLALAWLLPGCDEVKEYTFDDVIFLNAASVDLFYGDQYQLTASPTTGTFGWESENTGIATVTSTGVVEAVGIGTTNIIVTWGDIQKLLPVTVSVPTIDNVTARPGNRRTLLELDIRSERIKTARIIRMDNNESIEENINYQSGIRTVSYSNLAEGKYTFKLVCIDRYGNESEPVEISTTVYGDNYQSGLQNRPVKVATLFGNGLVIGWGEPVGNWCELSYTNTEGGQVTRQIPVTSQPAYLYDYRSGLKYTTLFLPESAAVDTFRAGETAELVVNHNKAPVLSAAAVCEIQARDFDLGGEGVGYHDNDDGNSGGNYAYREDLGDTQSRGVDVEGGLNLGYTNEGEWLMFTTQVEDAGLYAVDLRLSVNENNARYRLEADGSSTDGYDLKNNGSWGDWRWYYEVNSDTVSPKLYLTKGTHKIKFYFMSGGFNFMALKFTRVSNR
jgi:hypothetical protein